LAEPSYITSSVAALRLGYTIQHVRRLIRQRKLEGFKLGRDWVVLSTSVDAWASRGEYLDLPLEQQAQALPLSSAGEIL
jgi:excisionase family DNA binding protein